MAGDLQRGITDDPLGEGFRLIEEGIFIAQFSLNLINGIFGIADDDAVDEGIDELATLIQPVEESLFKTPVFCVFRNAVLKELAIVIVQFRRQHDKAFVRSTFIKGISFIEELGQFGREGRRRQSSNLSLASQTIPASVVLDTTNSRASS